jgi:hypothetical protein
VTTKACLLSVSWQQSRRWKLDDPHLFDRYGISERADADVLAAVRADGE